jgi:phosphatidylserine decarboxylase precursor
VRLPVSAPEAAQVERPDPPTLGARLFVGMQYVLPQHLLSRGVNRLARVRFRPVKNALIGAFVRGFRPQMHEAAEPDPLAYASFNEFFTRALKPDARAIATDADAVASPVDGTVSQIGEITGDRLIQAKGRHYSLDALLGGTPWSARFTGGAFATLYLAPYNYHRIHMPLAGTLRAAWYVPGRLFSVNATTAASVTGLFARNERVVCVFEEGSLAFAMVLVGALFVGSISTVWHGDVTPRSPRARIDLPLEPAHAPLTLPRGAEMGRFNMGSTVILLFPRGALRWRADLAPGSVIRMGEPLARLVQP